MEIQMIYTSQRFEMNSHFHLVEAAKQGELETVKRCLNNGTDFNFQSFDVSFFSSCVHYFFIIVKHFSNSALCFA